MNLPDIHPLSLCCFAVQKLKLIRLHRGSWVDFTRNSVRIPVSFIESNSMMNRAFVFILCLLAGAAMAAQETTAPSSEEVLISVADQRLVLLHDGELVSKYRVSTSKFGVGDSFCSYKTPTGKLRVCEKIGDSLDPGTVIKNRSATSEIIRVNAPGRDPIVTRILWLEGLENQNQNARARGIYIHGTPEERTIGEPKSWGCIRMRSSDVMELFEQVPVGTQVTIIPGHLPHLEKYHAPEPVLIAANMPPAAPVAPAISHPQPSAATAPAAPAVAATKKIASESATASAGSKSAPEPPVSLNQKVAHALMGSILMAGLPNAPTLNPSQHVAAQSLPSGEKSAEKP